MAIGRMNTAPRRRHTAAWARDAGDPDPRADGDLLERFASRRDEAAFEALVQRHGPMVLGVCRRVLGQGHDAEDAFQATFLVLVRKASSIARPELLGNWLYGVAYRTATKARSMGLRHRSREAAMGDMSHCEAPAESLWDELDRDLQPLLLQELHRLPAKYRAPLVLCYLEERTKQDAARQLRVPVGTVSSRLARGREMLRKRLARRGVALTVGALAAVLSPSAASASLPVPLVVSTAEAATFFAAGQAAAAGAISADVVALTQGVLKSMFLIKLKVATAVVLAAGVVASGAGFATHRALAEKGSDKSATATKDRSDKNRDQSPRTKPRTIAGTLHAVAAEKGAVTVTTTKLDAEMERTFELGKDVKVWLDGREARLADLKSGFPVAVQLSEDGSTVLAIGAHGPTIRGTLKQVDAAAGSLVATVEGPGGTEDKTFELSKDAKVSVHGRKNAALSDLKAGAGASLTLSADNRRVVAVAVGPVKNVVRRDK